MDTKQRALTDDERATINIVAGEYGRDWKKVLRKAWMDGDYRAISNDPEVVSPLQRFRLPQVMIVPAWAVEETYTVREARGKEPAEINVRLEVKSLVWPGKWTAADLPQARAYAASLGKIPGERGTAHRALLFSMATNPRDARRAALRALLVA